MSRLPSLNYDSSINLNQIALKFGTDKVDINHTYKGVTYLDIYHREWVRERQRERERE